MWPFKNKVKPLNEYNKLRASVGMAPAKDDDCFEGVAFMVVFYVLAPDELMTKEYNRLPVEERDLFMLSFATYLSWLSMKEVELKYDPGAWRHISPLIKREFAKQSWYQEETMNKILNSMIEYSTGEDKGYYTNVSADPWFDAVMATNLAGYTLSHSTSMEFTMHVTMLSNTLLKGIANCTPTH